MVVSRIALVLSGALAGLSLGLGIMAVTTNSDVQDLAVMLVLQIRILAILLYGAGLMLFAIWLLPLSIVVGGLKHVGQPSVPGSNDETE